MDPVSIGVSKGYTDELFSNNIGLGKKSCTTETTASVVAEGSVIGSIEFELTPLQVAEIALLKVNVLPAESIDGFIFQLFSTQADRDNGENPVYELDTSADGDYMAGDPVRDPNAGFMEVCYYIDDSAGDGDTVGHLWYKVQNLDETTASVFTIDVDYKVWI